MRYAVIVAGGSGTRLWPLSRAGQPKQLLRFVGGKSLLAIAAERTAGIIDPEHLYICAGADYRDAIRAELPHLRPENFLGEPMGRDTANAVGLSAAVLAQRDPDASFAVLTADHIIEPVAVFQQALQRGFEAVDKYPDYLVTFGITPTYPATGYGYLQRGAALPGLTGVYQVQAFREKPREELARKYMEAGNYAWNGGMFVWKARTILAQLQQHLPASHHDLVQIASAWDTPQQSQLLAQLYPTLTKISIDFAVMEKAPHVAMVDMHVNWLDVGSWPSYAETLAVDNEGNKIGHGRAVHLNSRNVLAISEEPDHVIATIGCHDLVIVHTPKATLVCPARDAEQIKALVAQVEKQMGQGYV